MEDITVDTSTRMAETKAKEVHLNDSSSKDRISWYGMDDLFLSIVYN